MKKNDIDLGGHTSLTLGFSDGSVQMNLERHEKIQSREL